MQNGRVHKHSTGNSVPEGEWATAPEEWRPLPDVADLHCLRYGTDSPIYGNERKLLRLGT